MQEGHQRGLIAMRLNETGVHVVWVACRVTNAGDACDLRDLRAKLRQRGRSPGSGVAMIGVDVLAEQGHLAHSGSGERRDFRCDVGDWP